MVAVGMALPLLTQGEAIMASGQEPACSTYGIPEVEKCPISTFLRFPLPSTILVQMLNRNPSKPSIETRPNNQ